MDNSTSQSRLAAGFEQLIRRGDHSGFFDALARTNTGSALWASLQVRSIEILMTQGDVLQAWGKSWKLKSSLTDPLLRRRSELLFLYLDLLFNGYHEDQKAILQKACEAIHNSSEYDSLHQLVTRIKLQTSGAQLMLGTVDARKKKAITRQYLSHIRNSVRSGAFEDAFRSLMEISQILLSKPLPLPQKALEYLLHYHQQGWVIEAPHRQAAISLQIGEILLERELQQEKKAGSQKYYALTEEAYKRGLHKTGTERILSSKGKVLLKYGKSRGKKLLDRAIHGFEAKGHPIQSRNACYEIIRWLSYKGNRTPVNSYEIKVGELRAAIEKSSSPDNRPPGSKAGFSPLKGNIMLLACDIINRAHALALNNQLPEAIALLEQTIKTLKPHGKTVHLAHIMAHLSHFQIDGPFHKSESISEQSIRLYLDLGYHIEATAVIRKRLVARVQQKPLSDFVEKSQVDIGKEYARMKSVLQDQRDLESQREWAQCLQAIAYASFLHGIPERALSSLHDAGKIFSLYGLTRDLAINELYQGGLLLEMGGHKRSVAYCLQAKEHFQKGYEAFKEISQHDGMWRSTFGLALSSHNLATMGNENPTLMVQTSVDYYLNAVTKVHYLSIHQIKTKAVFGEPYVFNIRLQKGADQLFAAAIDLFVNLANDQERAMCLLDQKHIWSLVNHRK
jgi:tetratricopeptide (TPR) repeat protein